MVEGEAERGEEGSEEEGSEEGEVAVRPDECKLDEGKRKKGSIRTILLGKDGCFLICFLYSLYYTLYFYAISSLCLLIFSRGCRKG